MWGCCRLAVTSISFEEPLGPEDGSEFGPQYLHGDLAVVLQVLDEVDRRHAASTDFTLDGVPIGQGGLEAVEGVRHPPKMWRGPSVGEVPP